MGVKNLIKCPIICNRIVQLVSSSSPCEEISKIRELSFLPEAAAERSLSPLRVSAISSTFSFLSTSTVALFLLQYSKNLQVITCESCYFL